MNREKVDQSTASLLLNFNKIYKKLTNAKIDFFSEFEKEDNLLTFQITLLPFQSLIFPQKLLDFLHISNDSTDIHIEVDDSTIR